jgi:lipopolysaccharide/colanic/teichoic acid biosynthesis glycosyltransferase
MLLGRAGALGAGLFKGFIFAPKVESKGYPCMSMHVRLLKRIGDIVGGFIGLFLSFPVMVLAAIAIRLDSRGSILFKQPRAGENGKPFIMFKLRTMVAGADQMVTDVASKNQLKGPYLKFQ